MNLFHEEDVYSITMEKRILRLILANEVKVLKDMKLHLRDLNFLEDFSEVEIDIGITPLILTAHLGRVEILKMILENESLDVNKGSQELKLTPLSIACAAGNFEIVQLLIENGANVNQADILNRPPLYFCFIRLQEDVNVFENHLMCMKMANMLLQSGADINFVVNKEKGRTLLMEYCGVTLDMNSREKDTNLKVIKFLVEHGADVNKKSRKAKTAFDYTMRHPFKEEVQILLKTTNQVYFHSSMQRQGLATSPQVHIQKQQIFCAEGVLTTKACCTSVFFCCNR